MTSTKTRRNRRAAALTVCCLGAFMAFLDATIVNFAFPGIAETFHSADSRISPGW